VSNVVWLALALFLVIEGLLPFVNPALWRKVFSQALELTDSQLRLVGLAAILIGLMLIWGLG
jgi:uncharacterized protein YjeT (DUF2065 family)